MRGVVWSSIQDPLYLTWTTQADSCPLYAQPWWLAAATGQECLPLLWSSNPAEEMPLFAWPLFRPTPQYILPPPYCQSSGPHAYRYGAIHGPESFDRHRYIEHLQALELMHRALPCEVRYLESRLPLDFFDWFPTGQMRAEIAFTHLLPLTEGDWRQQYNQHLTRKLRSAQRLESCARLLTAASPTNQRDDIIVSLLDLVRESCHRSGGVPPYAQSLTRLIHAALDRDQGAVFLLEGLQGTPLAAAFVAIHSHRAYYIAGGRSRESEAQDALAYVLDHLIAWSAERACETFDFEGSMHPGIAFFFRSFGATPTPYLRLYEGKQSLRMRYQLRTFYHKTIL